MIILPSEPRILPWNRRSRLNFEGTSGADHARAVAMSFGRERKIQACCISRAVELSS